MDEVPGKRRRGGAGSPTAVKLEAFLGQRCSGACAREQLPDKTQWLLESILLDSCREIAKQCSSQGALIKRTNVSERPKYKQVPRTDRLIANHQARLEILHLNSSNKDPFLCSKNVCKFAYLQCVMIECDFFALVLILVLL